MVSLMQSTRVDWDQIDEELDRVPEEFKDPRFDSLRHVLDILSAVDAEAALEELKAQQERIEHLVDTVVQGYHNGFNKAIHNYSQILHLFSVSKDQVNKLRSQLEDAQRRLVLQSHSLESQWKRSVTLTDTVTLLGDISGFVDIPERVQKLLEAKDWMGAVAILSDGCSKVARPEYSGIGALEEIKRELAAHRNLLFSALLSEIEQTAFEDLPAVKHAVVAGGTAAAAHLQLRANDDASMRAPQTPTTPCVPQTPKTPAREDSTARQSSLFGLDWRRAILTSPIPSLQSHRLDRNGHEANDSVLEDRCRELVACIAKIGGVGELQATLHRHMPDQIRCALLKAVKKSGERAWQIPSSTAVVAGKIYAINPSTTEAATRLVEQVFNSCIQVIHNLVKVLRVIGSAKLPPPSAGLELLLATSPPAGSASGLPATGSGYTRRELDVAWECMQKEAQALLMEMLCPGNLQGNLAAFSSGLPGGEAGKPSFSFDVQLQGVAARSFLQRQDSIPRWEAEDMAQLVRAALWGSRGSPYLTAHIHRPTKQFADEVLLILTTLDKESDTAGSAWFGGGDRSETRQALSNFLANFVENAFMPHAFLDVKARCSELLEDPDSMRARAKPQAVYSSDAARPLLPLVKIVETFVKELLQWAVLMPISATRLTGILENVLGRVLDAVQARINSLLGNAACRALSEQAALAVQMASEPASTQLGDAVAFFAGHGAEGIDQFVASILQSGFGTGGEAVEVAILQRIFHERPVKASALLSAGDTSRAMNLAAAADSLDYLADVIQGTVMEHGEGHTPSATHSGRRGGAKAVLGSPGSKQAAPHLDGLDHLVDRYRSLAGQSLRALRLDMLLLLVHHLGELPRGRYVCEAAEAQDVEECVGALQRSASRAEEDVAPFLPPQKRAYVFGGMAAAAARFVMWMLPELKALNQAGLARMCRMLAVLQPFLAALGAAGGLFRPEAARQLERARAYYAHLTYSATALIAAAAARPTRFTAKEYMALLEVDFAGRVVEDSHRADMAKVVLAAAKKGPKI